MMMVAAMPTVDFGDFRMRPVEPGDAEACRAILNDYEIAKWLAHAPHPFTPYDARIRMTQTLRAMERGESCAFAIDIDGFAGQVGVKYLPENDDGDEWELGYYLGRSHWGRGIMGRAAAFVVDFAFDELAAPSLYGGAFFGNDPSLRLLEKLGFQQYGVSACLCEAQGAELAGPDMRLTRERWKTLKSPPALAPSFPRKREST